MPDAAPTLLLTAAVLFAVAGMTCLALSLDAHWEQVRGRSGAGDPPRRLLRILGGADLSASLAACLAADHASMAALVWPMTLAVAAAAVAFAFSCLPARGGRSKRD